MLELGGVRDILAKSLGTANPINLLMATVDGLKSLKRPEDVAKLRGKEIREVVKPHSETRAEAEAAVAAAAVEAEAEVAAAAPAPAAKAPPVKTEATVEEGPRQGRGRRRGGRGGSRAGARRRAGA